MLVLALTAALAAPVSDTCARSIVGGSPAIAGRWDHHVVVTRDGEPWCSGLLVAPDVVLTAAHCAGRLDTVWLQTADLREPGRAVAIVDGIVHPDPHTTFDVAALILDEEVDVPIPVLATDCLDGALHAGARARVAGFGATDVDGLHYSEVLLEVEVPIVDPECSSTSLGCNEAVMPGGELIAGGDDLDACIGDSGASLDLELEEGWAPVALVSRGIASGRTCGDGGIYVRLDAVADWVERETGRTLRTPACERPPDLTVQGQGFVVRADPAVALEVSVSDPDGHAVELALEDVDPALTALLGDGTVTVRASLPITPGPAPFTVVATDTTGLQTRQTVTVQVHPPIQLVGTTRQGCSSTGLGGAPLLALAALLLRRRRRGQR